MKIKIYPKAQLEIAWKRNKTQYAPEAVQPPLCLRCGQPLHRNLSFNAFSRYADIMVCSGCGTDEALRDSHGDPLPLLEWWAVKNGLPEINVESEASLLTPVCSFLEVFKESKKEENSAQARPVKEVVYSRSDYDGYKWCSTWFDCQKERLEQALCQEIDQFQNSLFKMPEMKTLDTMRHLRCFAQPTNSDNEFNLYSETEHFFIWLRMITRFRDYNLYVHYYLK